MSSFEIEGKLHHIGETEVKGESFRVREFVIETQDQYPQFVKFQLTQDRCDLVEPYAKETMVKVYFDLRGREWQGRYFTNLNAWKIESADGEQAAPADPFGDVEFSDVPPNNSGQGDSLKAEDFDSDLPF
jgi:hypothetical protein